MPQLDRHPKTDKSNYHPQIDSHYCKGKQFKACKDANSLTAQLKHLKVEIQNQELELTQKHAERRAC
jgi:hypothetical protein